MHWTKRFFIVTQSVVNDVVKSNTVSDTVNKMSDQSMTICHRGRGKTRLKSDLLLIE